MKGLKSGPDLKMPELKVPPFLVDLYWDLRDRHLLPLVVLGVIGIVAVPFLLGGSKQKPPPHVAVVRGLESHPSHSATLNVVEAKPGLRAYRKRLRDRSSTNPFKQRFTSAGSAAGKVAGGEEGESTATSTTTGSKSKTTESTPETATGSPGEIVEYSTAVDVKITTTRTLPDGKKEKSGPTLLQRVLPSTPLPNEKTQAVAYMGASPQTRHPILLISDAVTAIFGEGRCLSGAETCQLLEVEPGIPETFVFGPESTRYKIALLNPRLVVVGRREHQ